eukprot:1141863-Pelagomonas_calceolata.AAC.1
MYGEPTQPLAFSARKETGATIPPYSIYNSISIWAHDHRRMGLAVVQEKKRKQKKKLRRQHQKFQGSAEMRLKRLKSG